jgi:hypothetical protein
MAGRVVLCCSFTTLRLALLLWNCDPFRRRLEEAWEDVEEARDKSGRNEAVGGKGEGKRCSRLIS